MASTLRSAFLAALMAASMSSVAADKKEFRYTVAPGAGVSLVNEYGAINVRASSGGQVVIAATPRSSKVEVDSNHTGNRVDIRTHFLQPKISPEEGRVDYDLQVPSDATITIRTATGPVTVVNLNGDISVDGDTSTVEVRDVANAHVHVRTVTGPITLNNIRNGHVEISSVGGQVTLTNVSGNQVTVRTTGGAIRYTGDFGGAGQYSLTSHSGAIDVSLPAKASVDLAARSVTGSVENDFPLQPPAHPSFAATQGRSFAGTANAGSSSVQLLTFSGTIRVKKQ